MESLVGKKFTLWHEDYRLNAYKDQMGVTREGYVIVAEYEVTVVQERHDVPYMWGPEKNGLGLRAVTHEGDEFTRNWVQFPDDAMNPSYYWDALELRGEIWQPVDAAQAYNRKSTAYVRPDGTRAVPAGVDICPIHDHTYYGSHGHTCFKCRIDAIKRAREANEGK